MIIQSITRHLGKKCDARLINLKPSSFQLTTSVRAPAKVTPALAAVRCIAASSAQHGNLIGKNSFPLLGAMRFSSVAAVELPPNLVMDSTVVLQPEPEPPMPAADFLFPRLDVPQSMPVRDFLQPGKFSDDGEAALEQRIFEVAIRKDIVQLCIRYTRHKRRQPKRTKRMGEISGSKKKPLPQKGTGRAQVGNKRNSIWRGGQKAHGPVLRDYSIDVNRKVRALGMMMVLAARQREGRLHVVEHLDLPTNKTRDLRQLLEKHELIDDTAVFIDEEFGQNFTLASRNMQKVEAMPIKHMTVYEILRRKQLVITRSALAAVQERLLQQYTHMGRRRALQREAATLQRVAAAASATAAT